MANALYPITKGQMLQAGVNLNTSTVKAALVSSAYTYSAAHDFYNDISATVLGTPQTIGSKTFTNGVFDGTDVTFTAIAGGSTGKAIVIYIDSGTASTSPLIAYLDTLTNLPVLSNGGDIAVAWDPTGIFTL